MAPCPRQGHLLGDQRPPAGRDEGHSLGDDSELHLSSQQVTSNHVQVIEALASVFLSRLLQIWLRSKRWAGLLRATQPAAISHSDGGELLSGHQGQRVPQVIFRPQSTH